MDKTRLDAAINRAAQLINNPHFNQLVESKAGGFSSKGRKNTGSDLTLLERQAFGAPTDSMTPSQYQQRESFEDKLERSGLPEIVKESYRNNPPVMEQTYSAQSYTQQPMNTTIDYNYIKYLIKESITECLGGKEMLNESGGNFRGIKMCAGNKIQLLDTKGNLYEAELKLKKKAQAKQ